MSVRTLRSALHPTAEAPDPDPSNSNKAQLHRIETLEEALSLFRAEVDMKLNIMQTILTTRNEQVSIQKKLLEREQTLYSSLLSHWENSATLAATGTTVNFTPKAPTNMGNSDQIEVTDDYAAGSPNTSRRMRLRKRRQKTDRTDDSASILPNDAPIDDENYDFEPEERSYSPHDDKNESNTAQSSGIQIKTEFQTEEEANGDADYLPDYGERRLSRRTPRGYQVHEYDFSETFPTPDEAKAAVKSEQRWTYKCVRDLTEGRKVYYHCKYSRKCPAKLYYIQRPGDEGVSLFRTVAGHAEHEAKQIGIPRQTKEEVDRLFSLGYTKPRDIARKLQEMQIELPKLQQLNFHLRKLRPKGAGCGGRRGPKPKVDKSVAELTSSSGPEDAMPLEQPQVCPSITNPCADNCQPPEDIHTSDFVTPTFLGTSFQ